MINIFIIFIGLLFAAFFAGTETAFVSQLYVKSSGLSEWWREHPEKLLATTLVGTNVAYVTSTALATEFAMKKFGAFSEFYVTILLSLIALIFCETLPKSFGLRFAPKWIKVADKVLFAFHILAFPVIIIVSGFSKGISRILEKFGNDDTPHPVELMEIFRNPLRGLDSGQLLSILILLRLAGKRALDLMHPLARCGKANIGDNAENVHKALIKGLPYIIVYDSDEIVGVLDSELASKISPAGKIAIEDISTIFIPESKDIIEFLHENKKSEFPPALVVDEHGEITGVIGGRPFVEKILRTKEIPRHRELEIPGSSIILPADTPIEKLEIITGLSFPQGQFQSIGGFIEELTKTIPQRGTAIEWNSLKFEIISADKRKIGRVKITRMR